MEITTVPETRTTTTIASATLDRLLDAELAYETDARGGFTSHLAMGLVAAARLGADAETLEAQFTATVDEGYLRPREAPPGWLARRTEAVRSAGIDAEVRAALPDLIERTGGAFHWMIRLELAIDARHEAQVANALGDWARRPVSVPVQPNAASTATVAWLVEELTGSAADEGAARAATAAVADHPGLLDEIADAVADLHWRLDDFWTLHFVTGTRAARVLTTYLDDAGRRRLARAHLHAVASVLPDLAELPIEAEPLPDPANLPDWDEIAAVARTCDDVHVVKLAYASLLEETDRRLPVYRAIAARAVGLA